MTNEYASVIGEAFEKHGKDLAELATDYYLRYFEFNPLEVDTYIGFYMAFDPERRRPKAIKFQGQKKKIPFRYFLTFDPVAIPFDPPDEGEDEVDDQGRPMWQVDLDDYEPSGRFRTQYLVTPDPKGDAVVDDETELMASKVPYYVWPVTRLGDDLRREVYGGNLSDVNERPQGVPKRHAKRFLRALAQNCTYDAKGHYYPKWKGDEPKPATRLRHLTDRAREHYITEMRLLQHVFHLFLVDPTGGGTTFTFERDGADVERRFFTGTRPREAFAAYEKAVKKAEEKNRKPPRWQLYFFLSLQGEETEWKPKRPKTYRIGKNWATRQIVDPKVIVQRAVGSTDAAALLNIRDDFDWFVEMVAIMFPIRFYRFDLRRARRRRRWPPDSDPEILRDELKRIQVEATKDEEGFLVRVAKAELDPILNDPDFLLLPQGLQAGNTKFIGFADGLAYMRNLETGHVEVMPDDDYVMALSAGLFYGKIAEQTAWIVPFATFMAFLAMYAVSLGTAGGLLSISAHGVRTWVVRRGVKKAANTALWYAAKQFAPAFAALAARLLLHVFTLNSKKDSAANKWEAFAKGFFEGYVIQTLYDHLYQRVIVGTLTKGPKEYRTIMAAKKVYDVLDKLHALYEELQELLDEESIQKGIDQFQKMVAHLLRGCGLTLSACYHLPHDEAMPVLNVLGRGPDKEPSNLDQWELEAAAHISAAAKHLSDNVLELDTLDAIIDKAKWGALGAGLLAAFSSHLMAGITWTGKAAGKAAWKQATKTKRRKQAFYISAVGAVLLMAGLNRKSLPDMYETIKDLLSNVLGALKEHLLETWPGKTEEQAELHGQLVGNLLGGFVLNRNMGRLKEAAQGKKRKDAKKKKKDSEDDDDAAEEPEEEEEKDPKAWWSLESVSSNGFVDRTFTKNTKHGLVMPIVKLLLYRYIALYNQLVKENLFGAKKGEGEFAAVFDDVQRQRLKREGLDHLLEFRSDSDKSMSIKSVGLALLRIDEVLREDTQDFLKKKYAGNIKRYQDDLKAFKNLSDTLGLTGFVRENTPMAYHVMTTHLQQAVGELKEAFRLLFTPFAGRFSWMTLLKELGLDVGDVAVLQQRLLENKRKELKDFKVDGA